MNNEQLEWHAGTEPMEEPEEEFDADDNSSEDPTGDLVTAQ